MDQSNLGAISSPILLRASPSSYRIGGSWTARQGSHYYCQQTTELCFPRLASSYQRGGVTSLLTSPVPSLREADGLVAVYSILAFLSSDCTLFPLCSFSSVWIVHSSSLPLCSSRGSRHILCIDAVISACQNSSGVRFCSLVSTVVERLDNI